MDLFEESLTVDEKLILFNTIKRAVKSISKHSTGYHHDFMMVKGAKFQALDKVLCLLAEELSKNSSDPKYAVCYSDDGDTFSECDTIKSVISGYVEN